VVGDVEKSNPWRERSRSGEQTGREITLLPERHRAVNTNQQPRAIRAGLLIGGRGRPRGYSGEGKHKRYRGCEPNNRFATRQHREAPANPIRLQARSPDR
jgi:hypothetical protein